MIGKKRKIKIKMERCSRRCRRGRQTNSAFSKYINKFCNFLILVSLLGVIYLMLEYHCNSCSSSSDLNSINRSIADIAKNVDCIKQKYQDLEMKICQFSKEIPKIEGQVELIEALTNVIEKKELGWDPRRNMPLPNVDVYLNEPPCKIKRNGTCKCPKPKLKLN